MKTITKHMLSSQNEVRSGGFSTVGGKIKNIPLLFLIFIVWVGLLSVEANAQIIFESGFEGGTADWSETGAWKPVPANVTSVTNAREGSKAVRFVGDPNQKRSEFTIRDGKGTYYWGKEYWVGFSINVEEAPNGFNAICQHHSTPHIKADGSPDWSCGAGPNAFTLLAIDGNIVIRTSINANNVNVTPTIGSALWGSEVVASRPYKLNQWNDLVLHFKYALDNTGFIEVWINGEKVVDKHNTPTVYQYDLCGEPRAEHQYQKIGTYYGTGNKAGVILYDAFRIGNENSSYAEVAPDSNSQNPTSIKENVVLVPTEFAIGNYPNPFNPTTTIKYDLPKSGDVKIQIYDIIGSLVEELVNSKQNAGSHSVIWNGKNNQGVQTSSGIYLYKVQFENQIKTTKMILMK